jgi:succinate dehydrogenase/fumarate reductase flavoprotein subunit
MAAEDVVEVDALVIGSGASGMAAAITAALHGLQVLVVEKEPRYGGTTARSGGWLWVPNTAMAKAQGLAEPEGAARAYLQHEAGEAFDAERVDAFLEHGPAAIDFFTQHTAVKFDLAPVFPDYHAEAPGGVQAGRSMVTQPFDGRELGEHIRHLAPPLPELTVMGMMIGSGKDMVHFVRATRSLESAIYVAKRLAKHFLDVLRHGRDMTLTNGNALAGRLAKTAFDRGIPLWLSAPARELVVEAGAVRGAVIEREGRPVRVLARRGVVLACGGFPYDIDRRRELFPHAPTGAEHLSPSPAANTGDGLRMGEAAGGRVNRALPNAAAWVPVSKVPRADGSTGLMPHFIDRAKPGVIAVLRDGRRFANEGNSYHDFIQDLVRACDGQDEVAAWLVCDHRALRKYGLGNVAPFPMPIGRHLRSGYLMRGRTPAELAERAGIDPAGLAATIEAFNVHARRGEDPQFAKGSRAYNRFQGDALHAPNPCVAPLERGPFYAIRLHVGDIGTFAGLLTDRHSRVLDAQRDPIPGLYAVGNDISSIMGGNYPGAGITLGPALTFGYIAGYHLAAAGWSAAAGVAVKLPEAVSATVSSQEQR